MKNINGEYVDTEIIRYFTNNDVEYLIYSLGENDEAGYIKLYASKIIDSKANIITDNDEWNLIKQIIKDIVRSNRDGSELNVIDLDEDRLKDIVLQDTRVFKLQGNLVTLLSENKKIFKKEILEEPEEDIQDEIIEEQLDYETLYNEQIAINNELKEKVDTLEQELTNYKEKIDNIKNILDIENY